MIGKVTYKGGEVVLTDEGEIEASNPRMQEICSLRLDMRRGDYSPADGVFGVQFLMQLARELNGELNLEKKKKPSGDVVY